MRYAIILSALVMFSCGNTTKKQNGISGQLENSKGETLVLNQIKNNSTVVLDSAKVGENGQFAFDARPGKLDFYTIVLNDQQIVLLTDSTETIEISGDGEELLSTYDVSGSEHSKILRDYYAGSAEYRTKLDSIQQAFQSVAQTADADKKQELIDAFEAYPCRLPRVSNRIFE